jgi:monoamine oxidase
MSAAGAVHDLAIVGAGSAGIAAAHGARRLGLDFVLLEAAHRIGGRGYTEELAPGIAFDLGCHWMHSASRNPYVAIADRFGFTYRKGTFPRGLWLGDRRVNPDEYAALEEFHDRSHAAVVAAAEAGSDLSVADVVDRDNRWTALLDYWTTLSNAVDPDQIAVADVAGYVDTDENWPIKEGYGALIARLGADLPVALNCAVRRIDWRGRDMALETAKGTVHARRVLITVSTGVLGAGDIRFDPDLPDWKQAVIAGLPLGTHNRIGLLFDRDVFDADSGDGGTYWLRDDIPTAIHIRPFDQNYVVVLTGGRHAVWLEKAGQNAAVDFAQEKLRKIFGSDATRHVTRHIVTAWHGDPWTRGSYSAALPGQGYRRAELARPIDDRLFFAGEAASVDSQATAHGAYLTGIAAVAAVARSLGR